MANKSIAQGVFLSLPPGFNLSKFRKRKKLKIDNFETPDVWEEAFLKQWNVVEKELKLMNEKLFSKVLEELVTHVGSIRKDSVPPSGSLPCELLLTGTNLPDHTMLLNALRQNLCKSVSSHIATLHSQDCANIRTTIQNLVRQLVEVGSGNSDETSDVSEPDDSDEDEENKSKLPRTVLSISTLLAWYEHLCGSKADKERPPVIVIIPDFESFNSAVISELIHLLSTCVDTVPFVLIMGVATSPSVVYQSLPRSALSLLVVHLFHSEPSPTFLNHVIEKILLNDKFPFRLTGRTMTFLIDLFLFHSFSVQRFVQGFKYCMMEHFYRKNHMVVCCGENELDSTVRNLSNSAIENIRKLPSFQAFVEKHDVVERRRLLLEVDYAKEAIRLQLRKLHEHKSDFMIVLQCLQILSKDLPGTPLGRHVREIYCQATSTTLRNQPEFRQMLAMLGMQAKSELTAKVKAVVDRLSVDNILDILSEGSNQFGPIISKLEKFLEDMEKANAGDAHGVDNVRKQLVHVLDKELAGNFLAPPSSLPLHELLYFDDIVAVRRRISGAPRAAIHTALNNPHHYLQCNCCADSEVVSPCLPDLSISYKLYLESNKTINLFDWLQSFAAVIKPEGEIDPQIQARFTRAVSELQMLGFIKPSRAKTDHVTRLTFGNF